MMRALLTCFPTRTSDELPVIRRRACDSLRKNTYKIYKTRKQFNL